MTSPLDARQAAVTAGTPPASGGETAPTRNAARRRATSAQLNGGEGRRERRKARTRAAITDAAMALFLERGFDQVTVAEIADAADVAASTVFNYFPTKEGLVFDEETDLEAALIKAVRDRDAGISAIDALHRHLRDFLDTRLAPRLEGGQVVEGAERMRAFLELSGSTPALRDYARRMWLRHEQALAEALATDAGLEATHPAIRALAHLVMETHSLVHQIDVDPRPTIDAAFSILARGWDATNPD